MLSAISSSLLAWAISHTPSALRSEKTGHGFACDLPFLINTGHVHRESGAVLADTPNLQPVHPGVRVRDQIHSTPFHPIANPSPDIRSMFADAAAEQHSINFAEDCQIRADVLTDAIAKHVNSKSGA